MPRALDISTTASEDGRLPKGVSRRIRDHLALFGGREVRIRISSPKRSTQANAYYWAGIIDPIRTAMIEAGIGFFEDIAPGGEVVLKPVMAETIHRYFKRKYLPVQTASVFGEPMTIEPTTTDLGSTEFADYIEAIRQDPQVLQLGVYFDDPDGPFKSHTIAEKR